MSAKIRILGQPEDTVEFLTLLPAIAEVTSDSGFRKPRQIADGRKYRYLTVARPMRVPDGTCLLGAAVTVRAILAERVRQLTRWGVQHRADDTGGATLRVEADQAKRTCQAAEKFVKGGAGWRLVLAEEVAEAFAETDPGKLRAELIQVAAVAVAWIEDLDTRDGQADGGEQ